MNQSYRCVNAPYATLTHAKGVQSAIAQNNAHMLLSRILSIINPDWLQHARSVLGVYEYKLSSLCELDD